MIDFQKRDFLHRNTPMLTHTNNKYRLNAIIAWHPLYSHYGHLWNMCLCECTGAAAANPQSTPCSQVSTQSAASLVGKSQWTLTGESVDILMEGGQWAHTSGRLSSSDISNHRTFFAPRWWHPRPRGSVFRWGDVETSKTRVPFTHIMRYCGLWVINTVYPQSNIRTLFGQMGSKCSELRCMSCRATPPWCKLQLIW